MKKGTTELIKFKRLMRKLGEGPRGTVGLLELLWQITARDARDGGIGRYTNEEIAVGCDWHGDPDDLVAALVECRWLDEHPGVRLVIHDWADHLPNYVKAYFVRTGRWPIQLPGTDVTEAAGEAPPTDYPEPPEGPPTPSPGTESPTKCPTKCGTKAATRSRTKSGTKSGTKSALSSDTLPSQSLPRLTIPIQTTPKPASPCAAGVEPDLRLVCDSPAKRQRNFDPATIDLPFGSPLFSDAWREFVAMRSEIGRPLREIAARKTLTTLAATDEATAIAALEKSTAAQWMGVFPDSATAGRRRGAAATACGPGQVFTPGATFGEGF